MDAATWLKLSPLLDELVDLEPAARAERLAALRAGQPELGETLARLLELEQARPDFLSQPLLPELETGLCSGDRVGPYRLERLLGEGGMGHVWEALRADGLYDRRVALKLLRPGYADANLRSRFNRERQILARLAHANIARLLDAGTSGDGRPYLAIEYVQGEAITGYAQRLDLGVVDRLRLFIQVCGAVSHAHANLVVHRDLKPSNILVTPAGDVRLLDFGIAKLLDTSQYATTQITRAESRPFTLHYAAPEQIRGEPVTTMTDVYAMGVVLYELLTGCRPYRLRRDSDAGWEEAILEIDPLRPSLAVKAPGVDPRWRRTARQLSGDLDNVVLKALRKVPGQRYPSAEGLCQDLVRFIEGRPVLARPQSLPYRVGKFVNRHALALGMTLLVVVVLAAGVGGIQWQARQALAEARRAQAMQDFMLALFETSARVRGGGDVDLGRLLDEGVRRAEHELAAQPEARAELLGLIARLHHGIGAYARSLEVGALQRQVFEQLGAAAPPGVLMANTVQTARSLRSLGEPGRCVEVVQPAMAQLDARLVRNPALAAELHSQLGRCLLLLGADARAREHFEAALALRRGRALEEAESLADLAWVEADAALDGQALERLNRALALLRGAGAERSVQSALVWRQLGAVHLQRGELAEAEGASRQALEDALVGHGALHPATLAIQRQLAVVAMARDQPGEARGLAEAVLAQTLEQNREARADVAAAHLVRAQVAHMHAAASEALRHYDLALEGFAGEAGLRERALAGLGQAQLLLDLGRAREARPAAEAAVRAAGIFGAGHPLRIDAQRLQAELMLELAGPEAAWESLGPALSAAGYSGMVAAAHPAWVRARALELRLQAIAGDVVPALDALDELIALSARNDGGLLPHRSLQALQAELRCLHDAALHTPQGVEPLQQGHAARGTVAAADPGPTRRCAAARQAGAAGDSALGLQRQ